MQLVVLAANAARPPRTKESGTWVLRLCGTPAPDEIMPPGLTEIAQAAASEIRASFPEWLWDWVNRTGILDISQTSEAVSWWWYCPLSEMSQMRSPVIRELYW